jgi:acyl carrier protein
VAYVVGQEQLHWEELRQLLKAKLPEYMVPASFVTLQEVPLTPNGKLDRKALPVPDGHLASTRAYVAPRTPTEHALARIWAEVLKLEQVGIHDNFFELGGHSLMAVRMLNGINTSFAIEVPVIRVFRSPSIAQLASVVDREVALLQLLSPGKTEHQPVTLEF